MFIGRELVGLVTLTWKEVMMLARTLECGQFSWRTGLKAIVAVVAMGCATPSWSALVLHLDANAPGNNPGSTWQDLSGNNSHFSNGGAVYNAGNQSYEFSRSESDVMTGSNASLYNFERTDAFSIVVYYRANLHFDQGAGTVISKTEVVPDTGAGYPSTKGYMLNIRHGDTSTTGRNQGIIQSEYSNRLFNRVSTGGVDGDNWHMAVMTYDGSSSLNGLSMYLDGGGTSTIYFEDALTASILNSGQVLLGGQVDGEHFDGEVGIVEIWNEVLTPEYVSSRWNDGDPLRAAVPEPASAALFALGSLLVFRRRSA